ncbi:MAG TPA: PH domain-containing protein [Jatrophihabitantaceae bacterium]|nr:PH domain-containing protein [Jatrophihabitantaceae bacterium]
MADARENAGKTLVFRLPRSAYVAVLILLFCVAPLALSRGGGDQGGSAGPTWRLVLLVIPVIAGIFIAQTATFVSAAGIRVRAAFGSRTLPWDKIRGLSITGHSVYAVCEDGSVRLPCVGLADLSALAQVSDGRLPDIPAAPRKYAPGRRSRR